MAHLDRWKSETWIGLSVRQEMDAKESLARFFWSWYKNNQDDVIAKITILFWSKTIRVKDLFNLFVMLFGQPKT